MRHLLAFVLMIALVGSAAAADLGVSAKNTKNDNHIMQNPGTPDGREGGETTADAVVIPGLPYSDTGNTADNINDYDAVCPYSGSTSPDVVYSYMPAADEAISVDLCGSLYDTKTYVLDSGMNIIACNDDFYFDDVCGVYVSYIEEAFLTGGMMYYIVVDGYGGDAGDYSIEVMGFEPPEPCIIDCVGVAEGEPELVDGYVDLYNSGCNDDSGLFPFQELAADEFGMLTFCGKAGWHLAPDGISEFRDTDWFLATLGETGIATWTLDAEQESFGFLLAPQDCGAVAVEDQITVGPCLPATMTLQGNPGDIVWLWVGASTFAAPPGFQGNEYNYVGTFEGLDPSIIATESVSFDGIKSLYR